MNYILGQTHSPLTLHQLQNNNRELLISSYTIDCFHFQIKFWGEKNDCRGISDVFAASPGLEVTMIICEVPETGNRPGCLKRDVLLRLGLKSVVFTFTNFRTSTTVN